MKAVDRIVVLLLHSSYVAVIAVLIRQVVSKATGVQSDPIAVFVAGFFAGFVFLGGMELTQHRRRPVMLEELFGIIVKAFVLGSVSAALGYAFWWRMNIPVEILADFSQGFLGAFVVLVGYGWWIKKRPPTDGDEADR